MKPEFRFTWLGRVKTIKDIEDQIRIRPVSPDENEHPFLMDMLLSLTSEQDINDNELHLVRSRTLGLILEMIDYGHGKVSEPNDLHQIFACGAMKSESKFTPSSAFAGEFEIWKRYQERQFQKLGLYGLWHEILDFLSGRPRQTAPTADIVSHVLTHYQRSSVLRSWIGEDSLTKTVAKAPKQTKRC